MDTEQTTERAVDTTNNETVETTTEQETISISKTEFEKLNQTLGSYKRELKDLKKAKEEPREVSKKDSADESRHLERIEKLALRQAGVTHEDDIDLARRTAKKWGMDIEDILLDDDFKTKLERQQTSRANVEATSGVKGGAGKASAKETPDYWIAKGVPPTASDVPNRKTRVTIARAFMDSAKNGKKFYND
jgi:hypothetical protein